MSRTAQPGRHSPPAITPSVSHPLAAGAGVHRSDGVWDGTTSSTRQPGQGPWTPKTDATAHRHQPRPPPRRTTTHMPTTDRAAARTNRVTVWDFAAIGLLAAVGFALSYDALRQMALAIHIRDQLAYLFPLIIDGFVAYSVRALLLLRTAPLTARAYVWLLFGTSTAASIWANTLHAVRLNQQALATGGPLHLSDTAVGVLSAISPLALAGAVHLGIHTTRHIRPAVQPNGEPVVRNPVPAPSSGTGRSPDDGRSAGPDQTVEARRTGPNRTVDEAAGLLQHADGPDGEGRLEPDPDPDGQFRSGRLSAGEDLPWTDPDRAEHARTDDTVDHEAAGQGPSGIAGQVPEPRPVGRPAGASLDELAGIAVRAWTDTGRLSRSVVRDAVRAQGLTLSDERLTAVMKMVRPDEPDGDGPAAGI
ncbi:DUF2637 domain-containing protein [Kitasatospora sp. NPDC127111]|uniref:DUF2637 domain-containing protein n=1 Tax=Kitasatospora sp. NPDC127111 TaxID=3345363 RepID=UPI0036373035